MKALRFLFSPIFMGIIFIVMIIVLAAATLIENGYGTEAARAVVYNTHWFEFLFLLLAVNLAGQIVIFRLYRPEKMTILLFHLAFILMIAGAAITRFSGYDGVMHIREGEASSVTWSSTQNIIFELIDNNGTVIAGHSRPFNVTALTDDRYMKSLGRGNEKVTLKYAGHLKNVRKEIRSVKGGMPVISLIVTSDMVHTENIIISDNETVYLGNTVIGFSPEADIRIGVVDTAFSISAGEAFQYREMSGRSEGDIPADSVVVLMPGVIYTYGGYRIIAEEMSLSGTVVPVPAETDEGSATGAAMFNLSGKGSEHTLYFFDDRQDEDTFQTVMLGDVTVRVALGSIQKDLPFTLHLDDFILDRYPGSNTPSGYRSFVTVSDSTQGPDFGYEIYMNHILRYRGYRFYQSSYDHDEKGTVLSVNHDRAGMLTTYAGYGIFFLFILLSLINSHSFFRTVVPGFWRTGYSKTLIILILLLPCTGGSLQAQEFIPSGEEADAFGAILVQDQDGRTKPLYTISSDILRKIARENTFNGLSPMQVFMGFTLDFRHWKDVPVIKVTNSELQKILGLTGDRAAFSDIAGEDVDGGYILYPYVERAYQKSPGDRSRLDKDVIRLDEKVNICYMMGRGDFLRIFPLPDSTGRWGTAGEASSVAGDNKVSDFINSVTILWAQSLSPASGSSISPAEYRMQIIRYQKENASYVLPSDAQVRAEIRYYKTGLFERLFPFYLTLGLLMVIILIVSVLKGSGQKGMLVRFFFWLALAGFVLHTAGLATRWYISGHAPMSNGYETMLFVSWITLLTGILFSRRSMLTMAATLVLAGMTLMVAHLSFMDPQITNLVPVLRSYWLTLHVSVITGSYGFLGSGAILGLIVLILISLSNERNGKNIMRVVDELTVINYKTLTLGLYFLAAGTFLGAIWANESWGRYWGWDPKETWSLITIMVYTLVTHSRMIPGMRDTFLFNTLSLFAFASVLMTFFGVNYYLSGMHSYAGGEAAELPLYILVVIITLMMLVAIAYMKEKSLKNK